MLEKILYKLFGAATYEDAIDVDISSNDFTHAPGFWLYVGGEGTVVFTTMKDRTLTKNLCVGYHCIKMKRIVRTGTDATDMMACVAG